MSALAILVVTMASPLLAQETLGEPEESVIHYHSSEGLADPVALLQKRLTDGAVKLRFDPVRGYLPALLEALRIPSSSQVLVFSKTSSQSEQTSPRTPRAIYFADDVSVGWVPGGPVIDLAAVDPRRGPIFYTLEQSADGPRFARPANCLQCHLGPRTINVPGLLVRSVYTASNGTPLAQVQGFVNGHNSGLEERWGGWYVTGKFPGIHLGNIFATNLEHPEHVELSSTADVTDLKNRFESSRYLTPHSDIVALLVLEHEVRMQNLITRANYETRYALEDRAERARNHEPKDFSGSKSGTSSNADGKLSEWEEQRIAAAGEMLLEYMLFRNEAPLKRTIEGTSGFAEEFQNGGPRAGNGRSLRQLDLHTRLLRYPCSFLVYSPAFDALPQEMRNYLWRRLEQILTGQDRSGTYATMAVQDRQNVLEILRETKPEFAGWLK